MKKLNVETAKKTEQSSNDRPVIRRARGGVPVQAGVKSGACDGSSKDPAYMTL